MTTGHCQSLLGSFDELQNSAQAAVDPQTKPPADLGCDCESAWRQLLFTTTIAIYYYYSARKADTQMTGISVSKISWNPLQHARAHRMRNTVPKFCKVVKLLWAGAVLVLVRGKLAVASWLVVIPWLITTSGVSAVLTSNICDSGWSIPNLVPQVSAGIFISGRNSVSGTVFTSRPSRARDLVTMVEAGPTPGRVKTGVGSVSRGTRTEPNSPDRSVRPTLRFGSE